MIPRTRKPLEPLPERWALTDLHGVGPAKAQEIIETLGDGSEAAARVTVSYNPFSLLECDGFGFKTADVIALEQFSIARDDARRHYAGNQFIVAEKGSLEPREYRRAREELGLLDPTYMMVGVEENQERIWHPVELEAELGLEKWVRAAQDLGVSEGDLSTAQNDLLTAMKLDEGQLEAVKIGLRSRVMLLTGGAGTGKTLTLSAIAKCAGFEGRTMRVMAFAGKAADRCREALSAQGLSTPASTIHRALGYQKRNGFSTHQLSEDLIVIDECSMLPNWLLFAVVARMKPGATLILVGDDGQLPPIGYGVPFIDFIRSGINRAHLTQNHRQKDVQGILELAAGIRSSRQVPFDERCILPLIGVAEDNLQATTVQRIREVTGELLESRIGETLTGRADVDAAYAPSHADLYD